MSVLKIRNATNDGWIEIAGTAVVITDSIADDDGDTKIQCEESADEDIIRFDVAGAEVAVLDSVGVTLLGSLGKIGGGAPTTADHGTATLPEVVSVVYGTGSPPTANTTPIGTLWVKYTA